MRVDKQAGGIGGVAQPLTGPASRWRPGRSSHGPTPKLDLEVPVFIFRAGGDLLHYGALSVARSLGRAGVSVYAAIEKRFSPLGVSRYCTESIVLPDVQVRDRRRLVEWLFDVAKEMENRPIVYATDDEAAIVLAEHRADLVERFRLPEVPPGLPTRLATKSSLAHLCQEFEIACPLSATPRNLRELDEVVAELSFPLVVKNDSPFERLERPAVSSTTIVRSPLDLASLIARWRVPFSVVVQEYLPSESCSDWFSHAYVATDGRVGPIFTGIKLRSWPPHGGVTANGVAVSNGTLVKSTVRFLERLGYRGIVDLDWRYDRRDGSYKLLDFNPRVGAQLALFSDEAGLDVVRAMHLDLTGRSFIPGSTQDGDRFVVEHIDLPARYAYRHEERIANVPRGGKLHLAWMALDDPVPAVVALIRILERIESRLRALFDRVPERFSASVRSSLRPPAKSSAP